MTTVSAIGSVPGTVYAPVSAVASVSASASSSSAVATTPVTTPASVHSPRIIDDPSAGLITEYLSSDGSQIVSQTPSAVTVAYLRQGLTADGLTKQQAQEDGSVTA